MWEGRVSTALRKRNYASQVNLLEFPTGVIKHVQRELWLCPA